MLAHLENNPSADEHFADIEEEYPCVDPTECERSHIAFRKEKKVIVPQVQSMQDYILKHHKEKIIDELNRQIDGGLLNEIKEAVGAAFILKSGDCSFGEMSFWRYDTYTLLVDVAISAHVPFAEEPCIFDVYCELWVNIKDGMVFSCGECGYLEDKPNRNLWMLSNYLVPILRKDEVEKGAEDLLLRFCPNAIEDYHEHNAELLAERMGLKVERYPLYRKKETRSMLLFKDGTIIAEKQDADGKGMDIPEEIEVAAGTIIINTNAIHKDYCQLEIYHECIHYDWHYMFFGLQDMHNSDVNTLKTKRIVRRDNIVPTNPLKWMEWQARRGSFGLMMPLGMMEPLVTSLLEKRLRSPHHAGQKFDDIARIIARNCDLPKFRVRARLLQMGYIAAKGALNYVDGRYIEPFAFSICSGSDNYSFVINRKDAYSIYIENEAFREQIDSGRYVYVDGHLCVNDSRYVRMTDAGLRLTQWANAHVDQCCLRFVSVYEPSGIADYRFGAMNSDEEYNRHYMSFPLMNGKLSNRDKLNVITQTLNELPQSFHEALSYLMKSAHMTIAELEEMAMISNRTISRLRTQERREYSLDQIIAICIALQLPPWLSREMITKAGFVLRPTQQHQAYKMILDCMFMDTVADVQKFLVEAGCEKLRLGSANY